MARPRKEKVELLTVIPSDPAVQTKIKNAIQEIVDAKIRIAAENDLIKEIGIAIEENTAFSKKVLKKLANIRYKSNRDQVENETQETVDSYDILFPEKNLDLSQEE